MKWVNAEEVKEMAYLLWQSCFKQEKELTLDLAIEHIKTTTENISTFAKVDSSQTSYLRELEWLLQDIKSKYTNLSNYYKIIRLFEVYRMLDEANLCEA